MNYTIPHYYKKFKCIAGSCPDTCCAGWGIVIDDRTLAKYRSVKGPFGSRLKNSVDWKNASFRQYRRRCAFLDEDNLCDIYREAGPGMLCKTCRDYPRHIEEFEGIREISLSLSCPEAAKLILGCEEPVRFFTVSRDGEEEYEEFDFFLYTKLADARDVLLHILQNRKLGADVRMSMSLAMAHDLQRRIKSGGLCLADKVLARYESSQAPERFEKKLEPYKNGGGKRYSLMQKIFALFDRLEVLKKDYPACIAHWKEILYTVGEEEYRQCYEAFKQGKVLEDRYLEQLMVYFVFTYFCGAVYDGRAYGKVRLAVVSTLLIEEMCLALWKEKGKRLAFEDIVSVACRYSREIEHSDQNLNTLDELWDKEDVYRLETLLSVIEE